MPAKVSLPHLIQDRKYLRENGEILLATPTQFYTALDDGQFRDGPVHARVAVVDLDADTRTLRPPIPFRAKAMGKTVSAYDLGATKLDADARPDDFETDAFLKLNPFATVLKTLHFFESPEIFGRPLRWAFPSEQLLIVPRAGEMKNAFYDRDSGSLQFYYHPGAAGFTIYTALSHDIIVHEATHAILDGLAPDLYHAADPQSLALHEAIADLSAITQTLLNEMVVFSLGAISSSSIDPLEALSRLAEEFGTDVRLDEGANFLRRLKNDRGLPTIDRSGRASGAPASSPSSEPHALSQVLAGAVYAVFEKRMQQPTRSSRRNDEFATLEETFCPAARRVARIVFRALDYLPPGEAGFIDYGRAFLAAARTTYRQPGLEQETLISEFVRRGIVSSPAALELPSTPDLGLDAAMIERLVADPGLLRRFGCDHAAVLNLPDGDDWEALRPIEAWRALRPTRSGPRTREVIFRFRWTEQEDLQLDASLPGTWGVVRGTTLVVGDDGRVLSLLTTAGGGRSGRAALLRRWADEGRLRRAAEAQGPDGASLRDVIQLKLTDGVARAIGGGRTLHLARDLA